MIPPEGIPVGEDIVVRPIDRRSVILASLTLKIGQLFLENIFVNETRVVRIIGLERQALQEWKINLRIHVAKQVQPFAVEVGLGSIQRIQRTYPARGFHKTAVRFVGRGVNDVIPYVRSAYSGSQVIAHGKKAL